MRPLYFLLLFLVATACQRPAATSGADGRAEPAAGWAMLPFEKVDSINPVLRPMAELHFRCPVRGEQVAWAAKDVFNPAAIVRGDSLLLIFRAEDTVGRHAGTSRLGLAWSLDGYDFTPFPTPIFYPDNDAMRRYEWEGGCEDPRIVESPDGRYILTYTAYDGHTARLCVASSPDLRNWTKHGLAFGEGKYRDLWSKSGAILSRRVGNRLVAERIGGRYWMYWGDKNIHAATSDDLVTWTPVEQNGEPKIVLPYRAGYYDSDLVEPGPPALLTDAGILLIYNSRNYGPGRDTMLADDMYSAGQALFRADDPLALVDRLSENFFRPEADYEIFGQINRVVFLEGLAPFRGRWLLYYGTADSKIAVAVYPTR